MAQVAIHSDASVATRVDTAIAAGLGNHLPVGDYSGADYRSAIRFPVPAGWSAWTAITKATLTVYISDFQHVGPKNSSIYCSRMNITAPIWSKGAGSQNCESGFTGGNNTQADDISSSSTDRVSFSSGTTENAAKTIDVTAAMRYYWQNGSGTSKPVFVFDNNGTGQYTELWANGKTGGYDATLSIDYESQSAPTAPTPTGPANGAVSQTDTPTFSWTHHDPQNDPQANAEVRVYDGGGTTLLYTWNPSPASQQSLVAPVGLLRGTTYQWEVRTADAAVGYGPYSARQSFSIKANPVVTINANRRMLYNGQPRLAVDWSSDQPQAYFQVTAPGYDSGFRSGGDQSWTLDTLALTNGTPVTVTVTVWNTDSPALGAASSRSFTPRWALTTHKKTLAAVPVNWQAPVVASNVPAGASLVIEYGSAATAGAGAPTAWYSSLTSVPKTQYLWWRAWFIPNATTGPTLDSINIPFDSTVAVLDKWGVNYVWPWEYNGGIAPRFSVDTGEAVYGTRSLRVDPDGVAPYHLMYSTYMKVREGRSYVLSGLMRTQGDAVAQIRLQSPSAVFVQVEAVHLPNVLTDWERYKTPVWVAPADMDVFVSVICWSSPAGSAAWWDGIKLEESIVATPWNPATVGATVVDAGGVQVDATKGGLLRYKGSAGGVRDVVEGGANGLLFGGDAAVSSDVAGALTVPPLDGFGMYGLRAGQWVTGGGVCTFDPSGNFKWASRFIVIAQGNGSDSAANGYYDINCPTSGAVTTVGGASARSFTAAGITIGIWDALYVVLPKGLGNSAITAADFRIVGYQNAMAPPPSNWVLLALRNGDDSVLYVANGLRMLTNQSLQVGGGLDVRGGVTASDNIVSYGSLGLSGDTWIGRWFAGAPYTPGPFRADGGLYEGGTRLIQPAGLRIQRGSVLVSASASNVATATVTFSPAFSSAPIVVASAGIYNGWFALADSITASNFRALMSQRDGTAATVANMPINWIAIGPA